MNAPSGLVNFEQWQSACAPGVFRFFSLGRHALAEALRAAGIKAGDKVLLPEFICRDVLASLAVVGAGAVWYPVGEDLRPAGPSETWPAASAVVAVNYFGFPQPFEPFRAYAKRIGAVLIEDNAHGFLSRDDAGRWLGTRGDAGIFSLRKTLPLADGAALAVSNGQMAQALAGPVVPAGRGYAPRSVWKPRLRRIPVAGIIAANAMTDSTRFVRRLRSGHAIAPPDEAAEHAIPYPPAAHSGLMAELAGLDVQNEIGRRRALYREAEAVARSLGIVPLFPTLPPLVSPYGFPFRTDSEAILGRMRHWAKARAIELIHWPDLPRAIEKDLPACHHTVWLVNFL
jgi:hypothetical protein